MTRVFALWTALLAALPAAAQKYDPDFAWRTLSTERFDVHFHQGSYRLALKVARIAEAAHAALSPLMGHAPTERTQIVISDDVDDANGAASVKPRNTIWVWAVAPDSHSSLADFDDYLWLLVAHEYTHILHLDTIGGGPAAVNGLFGKTLVPNSQWLPNWVQEGIAVFQESNVSSAGRLRSSLDEMMLRAAVLQGVRFPLDQLSNLPLAWPRGTTRYLYGGRFWEFIAETRGEEALMRFSHDYGSRILPFFLNTAMENASGYSFFELYEHWEDALSEEYFAQATRIEREGLTPMRLLTASGESNGSPRWGGGRIFYRAASGHAWPTLRAVDVQGQDQAIARVNGEVTLAASGDGATVVLGEHDVFHEFRLYDDLAVVDVATGRKERLTRGLRATEPDLSPDGRWIAAVARREGGRTALVRVPIAGGEPVELYAADPFVRVSTPRWSPDGASLAFVEHTDGSYDVRLLDLATGAARTVAGGPAQQIDPSFSADGKELWFASDEDGGVYNLWRASQGGAARCRVTNVLTGAFSPEPSPDGAHLAFLTYSASGFDVAVADRADLICRPETQSLEPRRPAPVFAEDDALYPVRPYRPLDTVGARSWSPILELKGGTVGSVATLGAVTFGRDVLGLHAWQAAAWYSLARRDVGFSAGYSIDLFWPALSASASRDLRFVPGAGGAYLERVTALRADLSFPFSAILHFQSLRLSFDHSWLTPREVAAGVVPDPGRRAELGAGYLFRNARRFALGISGEEGRVFSVAAGVASRWLGGDFDYQRVSVTYQEYLRVPWTQHHALGLRLTGGLAKGDLGLRHILSLGGPQDRPDVLETLAGGVPDPSLRGYEPSTFGGDTLWLGTIEYRLPLVDVDRGLGTFPLGLRRIHGALFADAGDAFTRADRGPKLHLGAGVELRAEMVISYNSVAQLRVGFAQGFAREGQRQIYYGLGGSF